MAKTLTKEEELAKLRDSVIVRNTKIDDVNGRIVRQEEHIEKTKRKKERFETHRSRWMRQNRRDLKRIKELESELGVDSVDLRKAAKSSENSNGDL